MVAAVGRLEPIPVRLAGFMGRPDWADDRKIEFLPTRLFLCVLLPQLLKSLPV